ncbi:hypothetical protein PCASD_19322 [Puccinia coronata f. sp. avenae]|uniref:Uncharacterized protein n=1 Tax=Puccinia coronata f. sp. avenae TaxID=200324 RepID=A0A2N5SJY7_9BASI|nr:hypothetical protein PCASD_19322 [Puccinia coronata f. sp. avenae]
MQAHPACKEKHARLRSRIHDIRSSAHALADDRSSDSPFFKLSVWPVRVTYNLPFARVVMAKTKECLVCQQAEHLTRRGSNSAATFGKSLFHEDDRMIQEDEPQGRLKTRRMMMGLGAEMDSWGNGMSDYGAINRPHRKRGQSVVTLSSRATGSRPGALKIQERGSGVESHPASLDDSVIVLRNHDRSEGQRSSFPKLTSAPNSKIVLKHHKRSSGQPSRSGSSGSKSTSLRNSVIVLRNHKRSEGQGSSSSKSTSLPDSVIVLKHHKRSGGQPSGSGSSGSKTTLLRDSVIVLRNHKRSDGQRTSSAGSGSSTSKSTSLPDSVIVLKHHKRSGGQSSRSGSSGSKSTSLRNSVIVLRNHKRSDGQRTSGAGPGSSPSKSNSFRDSTIVLRNHKRLETLDGLSVKDKHQPEIVLKDSKRSDDSIFSDASSLKKHKRSEDEQINVLQKRTPQPNNAPAAPIFERSLEGSSKLLRKTPSSRVPKASAGHLGRPENQTILANAIGLRATARKSWTGRRMEFLSV